MKLDTSKTFKTSDTALAAYLITEGFGIPQVEYNGAQAHFIFTKNNHKIETAIDAWDSAQASTNAVLYFNAYQNLLRRIKERY